SLCLYSKTRFDDPTSGAVHSEAAHELGSARLAVHCGKYPESGIVQLNQNSAPCPANCTPPDVPAATCQLVALESAGYNGNSSSSKSSFPLAASNLDTTTVWPMLALLFAC